MPTFFSKKWKHRYFVIAFVQTDNPRKVQNVYSHSLDNLKRKHPEFFRSARNPNELKGSEAAPFIKEYIFRNLLAKTDIRISHMVVDNWNIEERFRQDPIRSFNYLIKIVLKGFPLSVHDCQHLQLFIDNRNTAIKSLKSLEDYLFSEFVVGQHIHGAPLPVRNVSARYLDSSKNRGIQIADMVANTIYKRYRYMTAPFDYANLTVNSTLECPETNEYLYGLLKPRIQQDYVFPPPQFGRAQAAAARDRGR